MSKKTGTTSVAERLTERRREIADRKVARSDEYQQAYMELVRAVGVDGDRDPDDVLEVLFNANKTEGDLQRDAETFAKRKSAAETLSQREARQAHLRSVEQSLAGKREEAEAAMSKYRHELALLESQYSAALYAVSQCDGAVTDLRQSAWSHLLQQEREVRKALQDLHPQRLQVEDALRSAKSQLQHAQLLADKKQSATLDEHHVNVVTHQTKQCEVLQSRLDDLERQRLELDAQLQQLDAEKMVA